MNEKIIFIENFTLVSKHGFYKEEHYKQQRFEVSVYCILDNNQKEMVDDNLDETFNYEIIKEVIQEVILGEHKKLLETLAKEISLKILKNKIVKTVKVKITKPDIWPNCLPGVQITESNN